MGEPRPRAGQQSGCRQNREQPIVSSGARWLPHAAPRKRPDASHHDPETRIQRLKRVIAHHSDTQNASSSSSVRGRAQRRRKSLASPPSRQLSAQDASAGALLPPCAALWCATSATASTNRAPHAGHASRRRASPPPPCAASACAMSSATSAKRAPQVGQASGPPGPPCALRAAVPRRLLAGSAYCAAAAARLSAGVGRRGSAGGAGGAARHPCCAGCAAARAAAARAAAAAALAALQPWSSGKRCLRHVARPQARHATRLLNVSFSRQPPTGHRGLCTRCA